MGTIIDPSWATKYTEYNAPMNQVPMSPELEFYNVMSVNDDVPAPYLNELDCKILDGSTMVMPKTTDAQATAATDLLTTVKKLDANNVNCADAQLTFMMLSVLINQPGVTDLNPDLAYAIWTPNAMPVIRKCNIELG